MHVQNDVCTTSERQLRLRLEGKVADGAARGKAQPHPAFHHHVCESQTRRKHFIHLQRHLRLTLQRPTCQHRLQRRRRVAAHIDAAHAQ